MNKELALLTKIEKDNEWFRLNFNELQDRHENRFIAVKDREIVGSEPSFQKLIESLRHKKENPAFILVKFMPEKGVSVII